MLQACSVEAGLTSYINMENDLEAAARPDTSAMSLGESIRLPGNLHIIPSHFLGSIRDWSISPLCSIVIDVPFVFLVVSKRQLVSTSAGSLFNIAFSMFVCKYIYDHLSTNLPLACWFLSPFFFYIFLYLGPTEFNWMICQMLLDRASKQRGRGMDMALASSRTMEPHTASHYWCFFDLLDVHFMINSSMVPTLAPNLVIPSSFTLFRGTICLKELFHHLVKKWIWDVDTVHETKYWTKILIPDKKSFNISSFNFP